MRLFNKKKYRKYNKEELESLILSHVVEILKKYKNRNLEKPTLDTNLQEDYSFDSLDMVDIFIHIEDETGLSIKFEDVSHFETIREIVNFIEYKKEKR